MKKIVLISFVVLMVALLGYKLFGFDMKSYDQAKKQTVRFFNKNQEEFLNAKDRVIEQKDAEGVAVKDITYIDYESDKKSETVFFDYDAQGMLGGQYWGLYYSSDNTPKIQSDTIELTEAQTDGCFFWQEPEGNNYYATERISENWFFYYKDYDGTRHELDWQSK